MRHSQAQVENSRLEAERRRTFKGTARISLDVLHFQRYKHRDLNTNHVEYLKGCFQKDRCRRLEVRNRIEAEIDQQILNTALQNSDNFQLECLHGQHRIQAAREFLLPTDKWWAVDLYTSDINKDLKTSLIEQFSSEDQLSDGEAYYKIRHYHFQHDTESEMRWKAYLRGSRLTNLKALLKDEMLTAGFDALLDIPGIWDGMMLTTLQKMMAMGCKYEILNYLGYIKKVFSDLVGGDKHAMAKIDRTTVKALEQRAPGASTVDAQFLRNQLRGGGIFSAFSDRERDKIWDRLRMVDGLVPSLFTFFRDIQYLKLCVDCLKRLAIVPKRESVRETIQINYSDVNQTEGYVKIQVTEDSFVRRAGIPADRVDLGYRQLVAMAMRHYPDMPADPFSGNPVQKATKNADPSVLGKLADLAYELGFDSTQIRSLKQHQDSRITRDDLQPPPLLVTSGPGVAMPHRCGIPRRGAYEEVRDSLYINHFHDEQRHQGEGITSFFVRKSVYLAFFGKPASTNGGTTHRSPTGSLSISLGGRGSSPKRHDKGESQGSPEHTEEDVEYILSSYVHRGNDKFQDSRDILKDTGETHDLAIVFHGSGERERQEEREQREREEREEKEKRNGKKREQERIAQAKKERKRPAQKCLEQERLEKKRLEKRLKKQRLEEQRLEEQGLEEQWLEEQWLEEQWLEEQRLEEQRLEKRRLEQGKVSINFILHERDS